MTDYLLFRLYGPLASWGDMAVGEFRPSHGHPTRTAVLGLVAAALGIRRVEEDRLQALDQVCRVAVRLDAPGEVLRDYHTIQVPPEQKKVRHYTRRDELRADKLHTVLSQRDYRTDTAASIALQVRTGVADINLETISRALKNPVLPLYLGRKSCPLALPMEPVIIQADTLKAAFDAYPDTVTRLKELVDDLHAYGPGLGAPKQIRYYWEEGEAAPGMSPEMIYQRRDSLRNRKRWQFDLRNEHYAAHNRIREDA